MSFNPHLYFADDPSARDAFDKMKPKEQQRLTAALASNCDHKGRGPEVTTPPMKGSRQHPYG